MAYAALLGDLDPQAAPSLGPGNGGVTSASAGTLSIPSLASLPRCGERTSRRRPKMSKTRRASLRQRAYRTKLGVLPRGAARR